MSYDEALASLERKYEALLSAYQRQEQTMKKVAAILRAWNGLHFNHGGLDGLAHLLDPREPISEADAAERFSKDCEKRKT